jgi:hypothetical protein
MRIRRVLVAGIAVIAVSAGGVLALLVLADGRTPATTSQQPARTSATTALEGQVGLVVVDQQLGVFFTQGAFPYIRLESAEGQVVAEHLLHETRSVLPLLRQRVSPGTYRLVSYQRSCEGSCPRRGTRGLDPPTMRCEATLEVASAQTVTALIRSDGGPRCRVVIGERVGRNLAHERAFDTCRHAASGRHQRLTYWANNWGAGSTRPRDVGASYTEMTFRGFEPWIREAAVGGCIEGIGTVTHPIRFRLDDQYTAGQNVDVAIANVGTRAYLFEFYYQACFLSYFDSSGRRFIIPPGTHCDIRGKEIIRPGETKQLFSWRLDECVKDRWGCVRSRPLPPGTYTIAGRFKPKAEGTPVRAVKTLEIVEA